MCSPFTFHHPSSQPLVRSLCRQGTALRDTRPTPAPKSARGVAWGRGVAGTGRDGTSMACSATTPTDAT